MFRQFFTTGIATGIKEQQWLVFSGTLIVFRTDFQLVSTKLVRLKIDEEKILFNLFNDLV